jgi:glycosyltransferase involved in cell wall biosynthesis
MHDKKIVAIVLNTSWNIFNFRMNIVKALQKEGYRVLCIAPEDAYSNYLQEAGAEFVPVAMESRGVNPIKDVMLCFNLWRIYKQYKPLVVLHYTIKPNLYGTVAARICGIPAVNNVSGLGTVFLNNQLSSRIARAMYRFAFKFPFRVFFQNKDDQQLFLNSKFVAPTVCKVLPGSGVNLNKFKVTPFKRQTPFVFLMASRLIYDKGLVEYLEASVLVKERLGDRVVFALQGAPADLDAAGITKEFLEIKLGKYPVLYYPFTDRIEEFIEKADVVVLPSYREGLSRLLLESAAMGKPLIATDVPGCRDVVREGINGLLCKVKSADSLSEAMVAMFEKSDEELNAYALQSRKIVEEEFSEELVTNAYLQAVEEAIKRIK